MNASVYANRTKGGLSSNNQYSAVRWKPTNQKRFSYDYPRVCFKLFWWNKLSGGVQTQFIVYVVVSWHVQIMLWIKQCHLTKTKHFSETFYSTLGPGPVIISAGKQKIQRFEFHSNGHGVKCKRNVPPTHQYVLVQWCETKFVMNGQSQQIWVWCCLAETLAIWLTRGHSQLCTVVAIQALVAFRWIFIPVATDQWCFALYRSDLHHAVHASNAVAIWVQLFISIIWHVSEHGWCTWIWFSGILMTYSNNMRPTSGNMNRGPPQAFQSVPASKWPQDFTADGLDLWRCRLSNLDSHCNCCVFRKCANSDYHSIKWNLLNGYIDTTDKQILSFNIYDGFCPRCLLKSAGRRTGVFEFIWCCKTLLTHCATVNNYDIVGVLQQKMLGRELPHRWQISARWFGTE